MCKAITKSGKRCKIKSANYFCHIHCNALQPPIEEQKELFVKQKETEREEMLQKILNNHLQSQVETWPLFEGIDLTSEALGIIKRMQYLCNLSEEAVGVLTSNYLNEEQDGVTKYGLIRDTISQTVKIGTTKDILLKIQKVELIRDASLLYIKFALSRGIYWQGLEVARRFYIYKLIPTRETYLNQYREEQINNLRVKEAKKYTPICDDVCNYIIAKYL